MKISRISEQTKVMCTRWRAPPARRANRLPPQPHIQPMNLKGLIKMTNFNYLPSNEKWPELAKNVRPPFPIHYLPEDCAR